MIDSARRRDFTKRAGNWLSTPRGLTVVFGVGVLARLLLGAFGGYAGDLGIFRIWADKLAEVGPGRFYEPGYFADYPPGYLYVLWALAGVTRLFGGVSPPDYLLKLPAILSDVALAWVSMELAARMAPSLKSRIRVRPLVAALVLFNPAIFFLSTSWGQVDSLAGLILVGAFLLMATGRQSLGRDAGAVVLLAFGFASKPLVAIVLPVVAVFLVWKCLRRRDTSGRRPDVATGVLRLAGMGALGLMVWLGLGVPFGQSPVETVRFYSEASSNYSYTSVYGFNFWGVAGFWKPDVGAEASRLFGLTAYQAGMSLFLGGLAFLGWRSWRALERGVHEARVLTASAAAVGLLGYAVLTRMHERYLFVGLACLIPLAGWRWARRASIVLSGFFLINLYFAYVVHLEFKELPSWRIDGLYFLIYGAGVDTIQQKLLSALTGVACIAVVGALGRRLRRSFDPATVPPARSKRALAPVELRLHDIDRRAAWIALLVLAAVLPTRLIGLSSPPGMQFDEVYHARAAGEYVEGKEIYEYTHPPLAKELMALALRYVPHVRIDGTAPAPAGLSEGLAASNGRMLAWAFAQGDAGTVRTGSYNNTCGVTQTSSVAVDFAPTAVAVTSEGETVVGGAAADGGALSVVRYGVPERRVQLDAAPSSVAVLDDSLFAVVDGELLMFGRNQSGESLATEVGEVVGAPDGENVWTSFPKQRLVVEYDRRGRSHAEVTLFVPPRSLLLSPDSISGLDRLLAGGEDGKRLESVNVSGGEYASDLRVDVDLLGQVPESDIAWVSAGRELHLIEALGLTVVGSQTIPERPVALLGDQGNNYIVAVGPDRITCVSGDGAFAWRLGSAIFGSGLVALVFLLAIRIAGNLRAALVAAALVAFDGLTFVLSRVAMIEAYVVFFIVAAWLCAFSVLHHAGKIANAEPSSKRRARVTTLAWLLACALAAGCAAASKWTGFYALFGILLLFVWDVWRRRERGVGGLVKNPLVSLSLVGTALAVIPLLVYLVTYVPYFRLGHSLGDLWGLQQSMYDYHAHLTAGHPYSSAWYEWLFGRKAVYFFASSLGDSQSQIWTIANPVVLLGGLPAVAAMAFRSWVMRESRLALVPWAVLLQFVPYVLISRALFLYHYFPVVPFLAVAAGWWVSTRALARDQRRRFSSADVAVVVASVVLAFLALLPMLDGWWVSQGYLDTVRSWLPWMF